MKRIISIMLCVVLALSCAAMSVVSASADTNTKPRYVALVLDISYSMDAGSPSRLTLEKQAAISFCETALGTKGNKVSVVVFGSGAEVLCDFTDNIDLLTSKINDIETDGATYFYDAFETANKVLDDEQAKGVDFERNIVLCSDGTPLGGKKLEEYVYTEDDDPYYDNANAALKYVNEVVKSTTRVYTIGFYQNLSGKSLNFANRFMGDLSTENSVIVDNGEDLIKVFDDYANDIIKDDVDTPDTPDKPTDNTSSRNSSSSSSSSSKAASTSAQTNSTAALSAQAIQTGDSTVSFAAVFSLAVTALAVMAFALTKKKSQD